MQPALAQTRFQHWIAGPGGPITGEADVPGDKSVSHRAVMLAGIAQGASYINGFLEGEDTIATTEIFRKMGIRIDAPTPTVRVVYGEGMHGLNEPQGPLDCGNAGTAMRLLIGLLSGQRFCSTLTGDVSLSRRPMRRVITPLTRMGAWVAAEADGTPPLEIRQVDRLHGIEFQSEIASAQVKSAILLAGLYAEGETIVREPQPTRDYTERMLSAFGWPVKYKPGEIRLSGGHKLHAMDVSVPGDFSSAAFMIVAATLVPGSDLLLRAVGMNLRRIGLLHVLRAMGADITEMDRRREGGEAVADLRIRHAKLVGIDVPQHHVPDMIDEFPILAVAAACAEGTTVVRGAEELRVKESDRISAMTVGLRRLGVTVQETPDGAVIHGGSLRGGLVDSYGDHRVAMALAVAAQRASGEVMIRDVTNVATSFPNFLETVVPIGMGLRQA